VNSVTKRVHFRNTLYEIDFVTGWRQSEPRTWPAGFDPMSVWVEGRNLKQLRGQVPEKLSPIVSIVLKIKIQEDT